MKNRITPNTHERIMRDDDFIVSKTDTTGRITYGNQVFFEYSGYTEKELLGTPHNIVRHPDMPRGAFKLLWDTLHAGQECFAYVKNLAKDGSYYWVFANVTPDYNAERQIVGYFSVRRKPRPEAVAVIAGIYQSMLAEEQRAGAADAATASMSWLSGVLAQKGTHYEEFILSF